MAQRFRTLVIKSSALAGLAGSLALVLMIVMTGQLPMTTSPSAPLMAQPPQSITLDAITVAERPFGHPKGR